MASENVPLSAYPSKFESPTSAYRVDGLSDHDCPVALDLWQTHIGRLPLIAEHSGEFTAPSFLESIEILTSDFRRAALAIVIRVQETKRGI
jgi:hypothetical protein